MTAETDLEAIFAAVRHYHETTRPNDTGIQFQHCEEKPLPLNMSIARLRLYHVNAISPPAAGQPVRVRRFYSVIATSDGAYLVEEHSSISARTHMKMAVYA